MLGLGKSAKLRELDQRFGKILAVLSNSGDQLAFDAVHGIRFSLRIASEEATSGASDLQICQRLATQTKSIRCQASGKKLGCSLVALIYEARSIGTKEAFKLASQIQETAYLTMSQFANPANDGKASLEASREQKGGGDELPNATLETAICISKLLQNLFKKMGIYENKPAILLRPHALGYIWGWCDATTQKLGLSMNSGESLAVFSAMFVSFFDERDFSLDMESGDNYEILELAGNFRNEEDANFIGGMEMGGSDLFDTAEKGWFLEGMLENVADIFSEHYRAMSSRK